MGRPGLDVLGERGGCVYLDGLVEGHIEHPPIGGLLGDQPQRRGLTGAGAGGYGYSPAGGDGVQDVLLLRGRDQPRHRHLLGLRSEGGSSVTLTRWRYPTAGV